MVPERPEKPRVGDAWYAHLMVEGPFARYFLKHVLSTDYLHVWHGYRPPIMLCVPDGWVLCLDAARRRGGARTVGHEDGDGWRISGLPPNLTATPILETPGYAGYLFDGVLGDDEYGRTYPHLPKRRSAP